MVTIFLLKWQCLYHVTDNALDALVKFLHNFFLLNTKALESMETLVLLSKSFPATLPALKKFCKLDTTSCKKFTVCSKCHSLYSDLTIKYCKHIIFPANPNNLSCGSILLKSIKGQNDTETKLIPGKIYHYNSLKASLSLLIQRKEFFEVAQHWRERSKFISHELLGDVYDGKVWKELEELGYFDSMYNLAVTLNVDWFQPYSRVTDSVGVIYLSILNLPHHIRYKQENVILVGIIPGPKEPKLTINSYLSPLVDELKEFWEGVDLQTSEHTFLRVRIALICISCDIPAVRKACGFVGHRATLGCSKCLCEFTHLKGGGMKWSGEFGNWPLRTIEDHRNKCEKYLQCKNINQQTKFASENGVRFTVLLNVPYFNPVQNHVIDPMHNLLLGSSKHMMEVWTKLGLLNNSNLNEVEKVVSNISCPQDVGRLPLKIGSSFYGFTADQWRTWTTIYSPIALKGVIPDNHLRIWLLFVRACCILCARIIHKNDIQSAGLYLKQFCLAFIEAYGYECFTPNMHMHTHLQECCNDYGSIYGFWCFAFERYNGILGAYQTNKRNIESQLINKFVQQQNVNSLPLPYELSSTLTKSFSEKGTLKVDPLSIETAAKLYALSHNSLESLPIENQLHFASTEDVKLLAKVYERVLTLSEATQLKQIYSVIYPRPVYHLTHFPLFVQQSNTVTSFGQLFSSKKSRSSRNSVFIAHWPTAVSNDSFKRVCQINYFIQHVVTIKIIQTEQTIKATHTFCHVSWFKKHQHCDWFGTSAIVCQRVTENESCYNYIPLQRLLYPCAFGTIQVEFSRDGNETVFVAIPLSSPLYI